jgi:hypothetical protein
MSESRSVPAAALPLSDKDRSPAAPLFCWLGIQLAALSLGALRVPLAARFPIASEEFTIHILLVTQIVASSAMFPFLLRDVTSSLMTILTIAPFVQLAGYLSLRSRRLCNWRATCRQCHFRAPPWPRSTSRRGSRRSRCGARSSTARAAWKCSPSRARWRFRSAARSSGTRGRSCAMSRRSTGHAKVCLAPSSGRLRRFTLRRSHSPRGSARSRCSSSPSRSAH